MRASAVALLAFILIASTSACGRAPSLPDGPTMMYETLTGAEGQQFLRQISEHEWDDGGRSPASQLEWIPEDAESSDAAAAERAGQAAQAIATFLSDSEDSLSKLSTGWFGLQRRSVGQVNPSLIQAFGLALTPYQGPLVGDLDDVRGFEGNRDLHSARNVVAVIDTNTDAGNAFKDAAYERVRQYLRSYGAAAAGRQPAGQAGLQYAAELAGVIAGGQQVSGNDAIETRSSQYWINWAGYEFAAASGARPGDPDIPARFFAPDGRLLSPDELANQDLGAFSTAVENYAFQHGAGTFGNEFDRWYDEAAGK